MAVTVGHQTLENMSEAVWYNEWLVKQFKKYLKRDILEVGAGIGNFTSLLSKYGFVTTIDNNRKYTSRTNINYGDVEIGKYSFKNKLFDSIVCLNVLEHIKNDDQAIKNMTQLLKPGGYLIILVPSHPWLYGSIDESIGHYRRYTKSQVESLLTQAGLKLIFNKRLNWLGVIGWYIATIFKDRSVAKDKLAIFNFVAPFCLSVEKTLEPLVGLSVLTIGKKL